MTARCLSFFQVVWLEKCKKSCGTMPCGWPDGWLPKLARRIFALSAKYSKYLCLKFYFLGILKLKDFKPISLLTNNVLKQLLRTDLWSYGQLQTQSVNATFCVTTRSIFEVTTRWFWYIYQTLQNYWKCIYRIYIRF